MSVLDELGIGKQEHEHILDAFVAAYERYWPQPVPEEPEEEQENETLLNLPPSRLVIDSTTFTSEQREQILIDALNELVLGVTKNYDGGRYA